MPTFLARAGVRAIANVSGHASAETRVVFGAGLVFKFEMSMLMFEEWRIVTAMTTVEAPLLKMCVTSVPAVCHRQPVCPADTDI